MSPASSLSESSATIRPVAPYVLWRWHRQAWALLRQAPFAWLLLSLLPIAVEAVMQLSIPRIGMVLSKLVVPLFSAWALCLLHLRAQRRGLRPGEATRQWRGNPQALVVLAVLGLAVFGWQLLVAGALTGSGNALAVATGDIAAVHMGRWATGLMLASGVLPSMLLYFLPPLLVLDGLSTHEALRANFAAACRYLPAILGVTAVYAALLMLMMVQPLLLLVLLPYAVLIGYASWRDAFHSGA